MFGYGEMIYEDGRIYKGQYVSDEKHRNGTFIWPNGKKY